MSDIFRSVDMEPPRFEGMPPLPLAARVSPLAIPEVDGWQMSPPHPWRRYFARMIDYYTLGALAYLLLCLYLFAGSKDLAATGRLVGGELFASVAVTMLTVPVLAIFVGLTGLSPGKWIAGIRVVGPSGGPIGFGRALARELHVAVTGMAFGIPLVQIVTLVIARRRLDAGTVMAWDRHSGSEVAYAPQSAWLLFRLGLAVLACLYAIGWMLLRR